MEDKPSYTPAGLRARGMVYLYNNLADLSLALSMAGAGPEEAQQIIRRVVDVVIGRGRKPSRPSRSQPEPEWIEGRWMPQEEAE